MKHIRKIKLSSDILHLYNDRSAAEYLGVNPMSIGNWRRLGLIEPFADVGRGERKMHLYTKEELDRIEPFITPSNYLKVTGEMIAMRKAAK